MAASQWSDDNGSKDHSKSSLQCCEVCGVKGLSDEGLRKHLQQEHIQDCSVCPFCDMVDVSAEVMMVHVNEAHLDYLSPQMEIFDDSELYEDCMDSTSGSGTGPTLDAHINEAGGSSSSRLPTQAKAQSQFPALPSNHTPSVSGGGAVSKRPPLSDRSNSQGRKGQQDRAADVDKRLTRSASNSPAYTRRPVQNLNEIGGKSAPLISIDDNCNLHVTGSRDSANSSPSRSHLSLTLNTQAGGKKRNRSDSRRDAFASHRSNSTPVTGAVGGETGQRVPPSATQEDTTDVMGVVTQCPICGRRENNPQQMERHINQAHFDSTSPGDEGATAGTSTMLKCPLCSQMFESGQDVELHVNIQHIDILSPDIGSSGAKPQRARAALPAVGSGESLCARGGGGASNPGSDSSSSTTGSSGGGGEGGCPVCGRTGFTDNPSLALHIETHFNGRSAAVSPEQCGSVDISQQAAQERREQDMRRMREKQEFSQLQAQYGMDGCGSFKQQYVSSMQRAVYSGKMSITDYYERQIQLKHAEKTGLDDTRTRTKGLLVGVQALSLRCRDVRQLLLCSAVDHFGSTYGDKGWGCGYRNIQMLLSSLQHHTGYYERLFPAPDAIPSIAALQGLIEKAWAAGFDSQGCEQLGGKLTNTRKWIGATELCTLLSYFRIKCQLLDFHRPTDSDGSHPELFEWCRKYFASTHDFKPTLYLQHQGHSRTIIGCEVMAGAQEGAVQLLVLDPSHSTAQVLRLAQVRTNSPDQQQEQQPPHNSGRGGGKSVGYTLSGAKVVVNNDDWRSGGRGGRGRGGGRGGGGGSKVGNSNLGGGGSLRMLRRPLRTMKAQQYQVVAVVGVMETEQEYQRSKVLRSTRIPKT